MKTIPASVASKSFGQYVDSVQREPVVITKKDRPVMVSMSIHDAERLFNLQIEVGIQKGLANVEAGDFRELTPNYAGELKSRFKAGL